MNMQRMKYVKCIVIGFILGAILSTSVGAMASSRTETRQITFGVRVNFDGQIVNFDDDSQPFVMGGRTFLPLRAMADLLNLPVDFDPGTNTAYLGNRFAGVRTPLNVAAPHFDTGGTGSSSVAKLDSVSMGGATYNNALRFRRGREWASNENRFTLHNLGGQFRTLTGYIGRVDGSLMRNATISFYGDGQLLQSYELRATDMPIPISVFVEGIVQLRIEVFFPQVSGGGNVAITDYALIAYLE